MRFVDCRQQFDRDPEGDDWARALGVLFEVAPGEVAARGDAGSWVAVYHFDGFLLCRSYIDSGRCARSESRVRRDDLDHFVVHLVLHGNVYFRLGGKPIRMGAMDIGICDLARDVRVGFHRAEAISLIFPRTQMEPPEHQQALRHGRRLRGSAAVGTLLARVLIALSEAAPALGDLEATSLSGAVREMVLSCLCVASPADPDPAPVPADPTRRVRTYIEQNLPRPDMSPDRIARDLGLSRSQLYRQFERFGGVGSYIRRRRLHRSYRDLCDPLQAHRRISDIAFASGFEDEAHFSRLFQRAFGMSPRTARSAAGARRGLQDPPAGSASLANWVSELS